MTQGNGGVFGAREGGGVVAGELSSGRETVSSAPRSVLFRVDPKRMKPDRGHAYTCLLPSHFPAGDSDTLHFRSGARLFEDGVELGPAHIQHATIRAAGYGGFSHWANRLFFSSSDNSSPIQNGRSYQLMLPGSMFEPNDKLLALGIDSATFNEMPAAERLALARAVYRRILGDVPLPDHGRSIESDKTFAREFARLCPENDVTLERKYNLDELFQLVLQVGGDVAECGAYKGGSAFFLARHIIRGKLNKRLCLFDSFEGLSAPACLDGSYWHAGALASTIGDVKAALAPLGPVPFVEFFKGWIPDRFGEVAQRRFCFVHIDVDLNQPTLDAISFFYPRIEPGGIILLDDYGFDSCPGATIAVNEFMKGKPEPIINLASGGAFIMKQASEIAMKQVGSPQNRPRNPDFDDGLVIWSDDFSKRYEPVAYDQQFDGQWRLFLEKRRGFHDHTGVETSDPYIDDRIFELTGIKGVLERRRFGAIYPLVHGWRVLSGMERRRGVGGRLYLKPSFPIDYFHGKRCLDLGCGAGRWTKTLVTLGAEVTSVDVSENALRSTRRFNPDTRRLDIFEIPACADLQQAFDFTLCWGVIMCTHDPKVAFENVAATVKAGGSLYVMVYAPTYHASDAVREMRRKFHHECGSIEEKIDFVFRVATDADNAINYMDMLNTFYNWTIPEEVVHGWFRKAGFTDIITLNKEEPQNAAWHVLGRKQA
jgi:SAM-dependent methyltransferase